MANIFLSVIYIPEAGLLTVTNVKVTNDLKIAKIYISFLENKKRVDYIVDCNDFRAGVTSTSLLKKSV